MRALPIVALLALLPFAPPAQEKQPISDLDLGHFMFFAVLAGLFDDGVGEVDRILEKDDRGSYVSFVYGCPICTPTLDAFRAYAKRKEFCLLTKGNTCFLMDGDSRLPADIAKQLTSQDRAERRIGLKAFVSRCVERRFKLLKMDTDERSRWQAAIEAGMKKGELMLNKEQMDNCPSCQGAANAAPK